MILFAMAYSYSYPDFTQKVLYNLDSMYTIVKTDHKIIRNKNLDIFALGQ